MSVFTSILIPTAAGRLQGIVPNQLKFNYNAAGELIAEQGPQGTLTYHYDPLGYLSQLTLPRGDNISWLRYGAGHVSAIRYNQQLISELTRNARYQETERTQGALTQQRHYDKLGRLTQLQASGTPHQALWRHYTYNPNNNLTSVEESQRGLIQLQYDAAGRLISRHSMSHGMHLAEQRYMDAADNLIEHYQSAAIQDNRVTQLMASGNNLMRGVIWCSRKAPVSSIILSMIVPIAWSKRTATAHLGAIRRSMSMTH